MVTVILAEKPNQAKSYVEALDKFERCDGYFRVYDGILNDNETYITYCLGHLIELVPPEKYNEKWKQWNLNNLPIFPDKFQFQVAKETRGQFKKVKELLLKADTIVIATDCDREGENIAWSTINLSGCHTKAKTFKRLWINSLEKEAVREGLKNLKNADDFISYFYEAQTRQIADWLIGFNASPLYTLNFKDRGIDETFSVGRVQTPTLYMIYQRQLDIENFKKEKYYQFQFNLNHNDISFKAEPIDNLKFKSKEELYSYLSENHLTTETNRLIVKNIQDSEKKVSSPKLHSLSSLQTRMNNLLGSSPKNTLEATEKLYLAKFLSYPRTNTHYITNKEFDYLRENIESYKNFLNVDSDNIYIEPRKRYCDSSKVGSHYAIILSKKIPTKDEFEAFSELEKAIYLEIAKTVVAMFLDDYIYKETTIDFSCQDLNFRTKGATPKKLGWKKLFNNMESSKEIILPDLQVTDEVSGEFELLDKVTRPPKLFTEGSLITAMKTASKTLDEEEAKEILDEVEGIGTEATRADIIETLKDNDYIVVVKKNIIVTAKGKALCQALKHQPLLSSVEMTAKWESYLKKIGEREERATQDIFLENVKKFILHLIDTVDKDVSSADLESYKIFLDEKAKKDKLADCPMCDGSLLKKKTFIGCSNYPDCEFSLPLKFRNKSLTETNILDLVNGKETTVKGIKSQQDEKKKYNAIIKLADEGLKFVGFANSKHKKGR